MAGLVIVIMFVFILSSGSTGGDFFDLMRNWFRGGSGAPEIATLYGERIDTQEIMRLRQQRELAHQYMMSLTMAAAGQLQDQAKLLDEQMKKKIGDDAAALARERHNLETRAMQFQQKLQSGRFYFSVDPRLDDPRKPENPLATEDLLDFMLWRRQADRLGIQMTEAGVKRERNQEIGNLKLDEKTWAMIQMSVGMNMNRGERLSPELLLQALGDEFRVRMAKIAILGPDAPVPQRSQFNPFGEPPMQMPTRTATSFSPHEFWEFYRKSRTEISVRMLPISAREFLADVKDTPPEKELTDLFDKYKEEEPNPTRAKPAFKQPRRLQLAWVSANATEGTYPKTAEIVLAVTEATMPIVFQQQLRQEYSQQEFNFSLPRWSEEQNARAMLPAFKQPGFDDMNRLQVLMPGTPGGAILAAATGSYKAREVALDLKALGSWIDEETKTRKQFFASALALSASPDPMAMLGTAALGVVARQHAGSDRSGQQTLPFKVVTRYLTKNLRDQTANALVNSNLDTVRKELEKFRGRPDEAKKYIAEAVTKFGLKHGVMAQPRDEFTLFEDPGLQELKKPLKDTIPLRARLPREYTALLEDDPKGRLLGRLLAEMIKRTFTGEQTFIGEPKYLYWATLDKAAYVPKFEEVKEQVVEAWKLAKARELAKAEAEVVAEKARKAGNTAQNILIDGSKHSGKLIELYGVTRLQPPAQSALAVRMAQYTEYRIPTTEIEFPAPDFLDKLLELEDFGNVVVLHDNPESTYYVVTPLSRRTEPLLGEFAEIYKSTSPLSHMPNPLLMRFDQQRRFEHRQAVMKQLRAEAKLQTNPEGIKTMSTDSR